jgi:hypothetical protein
MWCFQQADAVYNWPDFEPVDFHTEDKDGDACAGAYSKQNPMTAEDYDSIIPDFAFRHWPETRMADYEQTMDAIHRAGLQPPTLQKVGWIGNLNTNPRRKTLFDIGQANPDKLDIFGMEWCGDHKFISPQDLVASYAVLLDIEGNGWSARTKYFLWSHRPLLLVDRPHKEFFYEHLKPWEHYIPVQRDLSDLMERVEWVFANPEKAQCIADAAYTFATEHLTRAAAWRQFDRVVRAIIRRERERRETHPHPSEAAVGT